MSATQVGVVAAQAPRQRRRTMAVAIASGFATPVAFFATLVVVGSYAHNYVPGVHDPSRDFVTFYEENFTKIRVSSTLDILASALLLVFLVALVLSAARRLDPFAALAVVFAAVGSAVTIVGRGLFVTPTIVLELTRSKLADNLTPGTARFLVFVPDTMGAVGGMLFGLAFLALAVVLLASDLTGRRFLGVTAALMGVVGVLNLVLGGGGGMGLVVMPWIIVATILLLVSRAKLTRVEVTGEPAAVS